MIFSVVNMNCVVYLMCFLATYENIFGHAELLSPTEKACVHNHAGRTIKLSPEKRSTRVKSCIDFYIPSDWLTSQNALVISSTMVDIVLTPPITSSEYGRGYKAIEFLDPSFFTYGWNKIYINIYNSSFYVVENDRKEIVFQNVTRLKVSEVLDAQFLVTGLYSVVDCYKDLKYFRIEKEVTKIPIVFKDSNAEFQLIWSDELEASAVIGGKEMFICESSNRLIGFHLSESLEIEKGTCKIGTSSWTNWMYYHLVIPLKLVDQDFKGNDELAITEIQIKRYGNSAGEAYIAYTSEYDYRFLQIDGVTLGKTNPTSPDESFQACLHNNSRKYIPFSSKMLSDVIKFNIDFYIPYDWHSSDDTLIISSGEVLIKLKPPSRSEEGNIKNTYLNISSFNYGWNIIIVKVYNSTFSTIENLKGQTLLQNSKKLDISEANKVRFTVNGLYSLINCNTDSKYFVVGDSNTKIPLVFKERKSRLLLIWDYFMEATLTIEGRVKFICKMDSPAMTLYLSDRKEGKICNIYNRNNKWFTLDLTLTKLREGFRSDGKIMIADIYIQRHIGNEWTGRTSSDIYIQYDSNYDYSLLPIGMALSDDIRCLQIADTLHNCGRNTRIAIDKRIVGGKEARPEDWPWMAALLRRAGNLFCGGTLISDRHVLTAAHCVDTPERKDIKIRLGEFNFETDDDNNPMDFNVIDIRIHHRYNAFTNENDIAILKLNRPSSFHKFVKPCCLPPADDKLEGRHGYVLGWGTTLYLGPTSQVLREVVVPIWSSLACLRAYKMHNLTENMICASRVEGGQDSCQGDSGGPLLVQYENETKWYVAGIVSWGKGCGLPNKPGVYIKVNIYLDWIKENCIF